MKIRKKPKAAKNKEQKNSKAMILLVVAFMVLSGVLYMVNVDTPQNPEGGASVEPKIDKYSLSEIANSTIVAEVEGFMPELIAQIQYPIRYDSVLNAENISVPGLKEARLEVGGPQLYAEGIGGKYMFFRFIFDAVDENRTEALRAALDSKLGRESYTLMKACVGALSFETASGNEVYMPCALSTSKGEHFRIFLIEKSVDGAVQGMIGLIAKKVAIGPTVDAKVVNITALVVQGDIAGNFDSEQISLIEKQEAQMLVASFYVNASLDEGTLAGVEALPDTRVSAAGNVTRIFFNTSKDEVAAVLDSKGIKYSVDPGYIFYTTQLSANTSEITAALAAAGVSNVSFSGAAQISIPQEILIEGMLASVQDNERFPAQVRVETRIGDTIKVNLTYLGFGDQMFIIGADQI